MPEIERKLYVDRLLSKRWRKSKSSMKSTSW